jgi:hypothetical protein
LARRKLAREPRQFVNLLFDIGGIETEEALLAPGKKSEIFSKTAAVAAVVLIGFEVGGILSLSSGPNIFDGNLTAASLSQVLSESAELASLAINGLKNLDLASLRIDLIISF